MAFVNDGFAIEPLPQRRILCENPMQGLGSYVIQVTGHCDTRKFAL